LIDCAPRAEEVRFDFAMISDQYYPWIDRQGQSSFVWTALGGLSNATKRITIGTAGACLTMRIHPAIIAHSSRPNAVTSLARDTSFKSLTAFSTLVFRNRLLTRAVQYRDRDGAAEHACRIGERKRSLTETRPLLMLMISAGVRHVAPRRHERMKIAALV
jgi:hypothetical protein